MTVIELEYKRNYPEAVNVFLANAPEVAAYLIEIHGFLKRMFGGVGNLDLALQSAAGDFLGDKAGEFLAVTIEHDLTELQG